MKKIFTTFVLMFVFLVGVRTACLAQTTLSAGDIAFIGLYMDGLSTAGDGFTFILLKSLDANTVIYFTDEGWDASPNNTWYGNTNDAHISWTVPLGGLPIGTIVHIENTSATAFSATSGTVSNTLSGTWNLSSSGDQMLAYQSSSGVRPASPTFITAIDADYYVGSTYDGIDGWGSSYYNQPYCSYIPVGLTNGVNCAALVNGTSAVAGGYAIGYECDNYKYTGTLTGTDVAIRAAINTTSNWTGNEDGTMSIAVASYSAPSITASNNAPTATAPTSPTVSEDATNVALDDNIQVEDVDGDAQTVSFTITGGTVTIGTTGITFGGSGNGSASFTASGTLDAINTALDAATFTPTANLNGTNAGTISFTASDGTATSSAASVTFNITAVNDAPTATAPTAPTVSEDATNVALDDDIQVEDVDGDAQTVSFTITGGTVTIGTTGITFGGSGNGSASFTASGTLAAINTALDAATFTPTANLNGTNAGTISFTASDGTATSGAASVTFNITAVNDAPTFTSFTGIVETTTQNTEIEITLSELKAQGNEADDDGTVDAFIVKELSSGTLRIGANSGAATSFNATTNKTVDATNSAYWTPALNVSGVQNAFTVTVMDNSGAESTGAVQATIQVNEAATPTIAFSSASSSGVESVSSASLQVELSATSSSDVTVDYAITGTATGGGTDYTLANGTLTITAGNTTNNIIIASIVDDALVEGDETVIVTLSNPVNATLGANIVHTYTIADNDVETDVPDISKINLSVYPNPFTGNIHFSNINNNLTHIIIRDLSGKTIFRTNYKGEKEIDLSHLKPGVYLLTLVNNRNEKQEIKLVKE